MISKEAQESIKRYRQYASFISSFYRTPSEISAWRIGFFRWFINLQGVIGPKAKGTLKEEVTLGGVKTLKVSTPNSDPERIFLYYHGGGYSMGSPKSHYSLVSYLADISKTTVYVPDYRLGPENKYPAQLEDGVNTYLSLINDFGYSPNQIAIGGDSAGGNLALVSTLKLQELNQKLPSKLFLLSPWTDLTGEGKSIKENSKSDPYLSYDNWLNTSLSMKKTVREWYAPNQNYNDPFISPAFANFVNFPITMIQVSDIEILYSDSLEVASQMRKGGNKVKVNVYKNLPHVWQIFGFLPESKKAIREISEFLIS